MINCFNEKVFWFFVIHRTKENYQLNVTLSSTKVQEEHKKEKAWSTQKYLFIQSQTHFFWLRTTCFVVFPFYLVSLCLCSSALMLRLNEVLSGQTWRPQAFYSRWSDEADTRTSTLKNLCTQKSKEQTHKGKDNVAIRWRCTLFICIPLFSL